MTRRFPALALAAALAAAFAAATPAAARAQSTDRPTAAGTAAAAATPTFPGTDELPVGFGTLNQNDIAIRMRNDDLELRVIPLDERVLRLLGPDAYASLHGMVESRRASIDSVGRQYGAAVPGLMLVSFYGLRQNAQFDPNLVTVAARNHVFRPIGLVPLGASFNNNQLDLRGQATAIYVFEIRFPVTEPIAVSYGALTSNDWANRLPTLERERQRVTARAQAGRPGQATAAPADSGR
jgi:hypothetical protein